MINLINPENFYYSIAYTDEDETNKKPKIIFSSSSSFSIDEIKKAELSDLKSKIDEDFNRNGISNIPANDSAGELPVYTLNCSLKSVFFNSNNSNQQSLGFELTDRQKELFQSSIQSQSGSQSESQSGSQSRSQSRSQSGSQSGSDPIDVKDIRVSNALTFVEKANRLDGSSNQLFKVRTFYLSKEGMEEYEQMHQFILNGLNASQQTSPESLNQFIKNVENEIIEDQKLCDINNFTNKLNLATIPDPNPGSSTLNHSQSAHKILQHFIGKGLLKIPSAEVIREKQKFTNRGVFEPSDPNKDRGAVINTYKFDGVVNLARDGNKIDKFKINDDGVEHMGIYSADAKTRINSTTGDKWKSLKKYLTPNHFSKTNYQFFNYSDLSDSESKSQATLQEYNPNAPFNSLFKKTHDVEFEEITQQKTDKLIIESHNKYRETKPLNSKKTKKFNEDKNYSNSISMIPFKEAIYPTHKIKFLYQTQTNGQNSTSILVGKSTNTNYYGYDFDQQDGLKKLGFLSFKLISLPFRIAGVTLSLIPKLDKFFGNHKITKSYIIDPEPITNTSDQQSIQGSQEADRDDVSSQRTATPVSFGAGGQNQQGAGDPNQQSTGVGLDDVKIRLKKPDSFGLQSPSPSPSPPYEFCEASPSSPHDRVEYSPVLAGSHVSAGSHDADGDSSPGSIGGDNEFKRILPSPSLSPTSVSRASYVHSDPKMKPLPGS